jgi:hypothetical protein
VENALSSAVCAGFTPVTKAWGPECVAAEQALSHLTPCWNSVSSKPTAATRSLPNWVQPRLWCARFGCECARVRCVLYGYLEVEQEEVWR